MFRQGITLGLLIVLLLISGKTQAADNKINSHIFRFSDSLETVSTEDALSLESERADYRWLFKASFDHVEDSVIAVDSASGDRILSYISSLQSLTLGASYLFGQNKNVLVGLTLPVHSAHLTPEGAAVTGGETKRKTVLGDTNLYLKWRLTSGHSKWNFAISPRLSLPTGDDKYLVSDGSVGYGLRLLLDRTFGSVSLYSYLGYFDGGDARFLSINRGQRAEAGLGMFWRLSQLIGINAEINGDLVIEDVESDQNSFDATAGVRFNFNRVKLFTGLSLAGLQNSNNQEFGFYTGVKVPVGLIATAIDPGPKVVLEEKDLIPEEVIAPVTQRVQVSNTTLFSSDKAVIREDAKRALDKAAGVIVHFQDRLGKIAVEGHTDSIGSRAHNQKLSEKRAEAVKDYLISRGVLAEKLMAIGYGEDRLKLKVEKSRAHRQVNRRAEFHVDETITIREL